MSLPRLPVLMAIVALCFIAAGLVWYAAQRSAADLSRFVPPAKASAINASMSAPREAVAAPTTSSGAHMPATTAVQAVVKR